MPVGSMGPPDVPPSPSSRGIITPAVPPPAPVPQRPFSCPICGLKFQRKHDRKRHMHVHGEGKRFTCGLCHEEFARRDALLRHARRSRCQGRQRPIPRPHIG
ncbi:hypothetical protein EV126DRAFT_366782 [Verticillium dahliae]|nr:hypothetical protein EV126DRAFT_366782 [Verticillium dahliae]